MGLKSHRDLGTIPAVFSPKRVKNRRTLLQAIATMASTCCIASTLAQEVIIPDPGLNAAIREALAKPAGPLTAQDMLSLTNLIAGGRQISNVAGLETAHNLRFLALEENAITNFPIAGGLTNLRNLDLSGNLLTNLVLSPGFGRLELLNLAGNGLTSLTFPAGLTNLNALLLIANQLTELTLPPDMTRLLALSLIGNPLTQLVLSEPQATNLAATVADLQGQGIPVFTYPLDIKLTKLIEAAGAFRFGITGPPGFYAVLSSTNLADWSRMDVVNNPLGSVFFLDTTANLSPQKFYRAQSLANPPANMVFIPANTFVLGSPTNEVGHQVDESPQTIVRLSHGFWIGKYEVTQREYLAVTGENPSGFPGDLDRPVESVSFFAASNYCVLLTQQDLAAGRIPSGTHYRLPTEAEWECAARAGNTNRFYYGDDPSLTNLTNYAWFGAHNGITTHPVGLKLPNAWGLFDMEGNVWEWCQDWYGNYPGGSVTDPQGPATNPIGFKVIRGGAWEASEFDCRSARRSVEGASPFISDFIIGFRVVLVSDL